MEEEMMQDGESASFNRTFMELKLGTTAPKPVNQDVLIVPLWNWNFPLHPAPDESYYCSNRTFMELK